MFNHSTDSIPFKHFCYQFKNIYKIKKILFIKEIENTNLIAFQRNSINCFKCYIFQT